jgi:predicted XRE-type DNA-binding protein
MDKKLDALIATVEDIKRLLVLALLNSAASQADIAAALNINQSSVSRLFQGGIARKASKKR